MGDWPRLVNLRRCARGAVPTATVTTNGTAVLYNNTASSELILVWQLTTIGVDDPPLFISYVQGERPTTLATVEAIVPGDAPPPGLLGYLDDPTTYSPSFAMAVAQPAPYWPGTFPFAVLQPNWGLVMQNAATDAAVPSVSLFWEAILPKYFDRFYTHQLLEIELALKG